MNRPVRLIDSVRLPPPFLRRSRISTSTPLELKSSRIFLTSRCRAFVCAAGARRLHVHVKAWQVDVANFVRRAIGFLSLFDDFSASFAVLEFNLGSDDVNDLDLAATGGDYTKTDGGTGSTTDQLDYIVQFHVDDIDHFAIFALSNLHHAVLDL